MTSALRTVFQRTRSWLPLTQNWIYIQVRHLPETIQVHIVSDYTENLDQFTLPNIHSLTGESLFLRARDRVSRKLRFGRLGPRHYQAYLIKQVRRYQPDIIHAHFGNVGWENLGALKELKAKYVVTFYGKEVNGLPVSEPIWYDRYRQLFDRVDLVLCEGSYMAHSVAQLGCPEDKIRVHHLGVKVANIPYQPREWNPGEPFRVLIAASFREKKGIPFALEALGRIKNTVPLEITVIGDATKEPRSQLEKRKILDTIESCHLAPRVRLLGYQPYDVFLEEARRHHVFLAPSITASDGDTEGGAPVTIIEMMASGMFVVSTTHCDIPGIVFHGSTGLLADERDVNGLVQHLKWLVAHPDQWAPFLAAGREHVEREHNAKIQGQRLADIYLALT